MVPQEERLAGAVGCLVPLETAIQETIEYCRERKAFGQSLLDNQVVHYRKVQSRRDITNQNHPNSQIFQVGGAADGDGAVPRGDLLRRGRHDGGAERDPARLHAQAEGGKTLQVLWFCDFYYDVNALQRLLIRPMLLQGLDKFINQLMCF